MNTRSRLPESRQGKPADPCSIEDLRRPRAGLIYRSVTRGFLTTAAVLGALYTARYVSCKLWSSERPFTEPRGQFTLITMSHQARSRELGSWVRHYSWCPSVQEILIVWNQGEPPKIAAMGARVPVRLRVEGNNSLNNRFRPDKINGHAVLSLDDDIFMTCHDIEHGFREWQRQPQTLTGFHPRLVQGLPLIYRGEQHARNAGAFNVILGGAAFFNATRLLPALFSQSVAPMRAVVDRLFNCEDLLINFALANLSVSSAEPYAQAVSVRWRIHAKRLIQHGISVNEQAHFHIRTRCLAAFTELFGGNPLRLHTLSAC